MAAKTSSPDAWATACFTLGSTYYNLDQSATALPWLERTTQVRPTADVWIMLSDCLQHAHDLPRALKAAQRATDMAPDRPKYLQRYAELLEQTGQVEQAARLQPRVQDLRHYRQRVDRGNR